MDGVTVPLTTPYGPLEVRILAGPTLAPGAHVTEHTFEDRDNGWPNDHAAVPISVRDAGIGSWEHVIVCRVCHVPVRTTAGNRYPVHTSPRSRWCGSTCPLHGLAR